MRTLLLAAIAAMTTVAAHADNELPQLGCGGEDAGLRSLNADTPTYVTFRNDTGRTVRTYWLNYKGRRVFYAEVPPGKSYVQQTYVTHPWVITNNPSGDCVAVFMPAPSSASAHIR